MTSYVSCIMYHVIKRSGGVLDLLEPGRYTPITHLGRLLVVTSMMVTLLFFLSDLAARQTQLYRALVVMLSPSSDLHITPQIYISYEICGARRCSIPNTPSGAVILTRPFLSLINGSRNVYNDFGANDVIAWSHNLNLDGHSFTPPLGRYPRWTRNCVTRTLRSF